MRLDKIDGTGLWPVLFLYRKPCDGHMVQELLLILVCPAEFPGSRSQKLLKNCMKEIDVVIAD